MLKRVHPGGLVAVLVALGTVFAGLGPGLTGVAVFGGGGVTGEVVVPAPSGVVAVAGAGARVPPVGGVGATDPESEAEEDGAADDVGWAVGAVPIPVAAASAVPDWPSSRLRRRKNAATTMHARPKTKPAATRRSVLREARGGEPAGIGATGSTWIIGAVLDTLPCDGGLPLEGALGDRGAVLDTAPATLDEIPCDGGGTSTAAPGNDAVAAQGREGAAGGGGAGNGAGAGAT